MTTACSPLFFTSIILWMSGEERINIKQPRHKLDSPASAMMR